MTSVLNSTGSRMRPIVSTTPTRSAPIKRALYRANAADHDHHEGEDQHRLAHPDLHRLDRADQAPATPASAAPSAKTTV